MCLHRRMMDPVPRIKRLQSNLVWACVALAGTIFAFLNIKILHISIPGFSGCYWAFILFTESFLIAFFDWQIRRLGHNGK
jgi:hypothetical protein